MIKIEKNLDVYLKYIKKFKFKTSKKVIYTCFFGDKEIIPDQNVIISGFEYFCFTDQNPKKLTKSWNYIVLNKTFINGRYTSRLLKCNSNILFPISNICIWIDSRIILKKNFQNFILKKVNNNKFNIYLFRHRKRRYLISEVISNIFYLKDRPLMLLYQYFNYKLSGYFFEDILPETGIIIRNNLNLKTISFNKEWYQNIIKFSVRDQLSIGFVLKSFQNDYVISKNTIDDYAKVIPRIDYKYNDKNISSVNFISVLIEKVKNFNETI